MLAEAGERHGVPQLPAVVSSCDQWEWYTLQVRWGEVRAVEKLTDQSLLSSSEGIENLALTFSGQTSLKQEYQSHNIRGEL